MRLMQVIKIVPVDRFAKAIINQILVAKGINAVAAFLFLGSSTAALIQQQIKCNGIEECFGFIGLKVPQQVAQRLYLVVALER